MRNQLTGSGLGSIVVGFWLVALPDLVQFWPIFIIIGGLASLWSYLRDDRHNTGLVFVGVLALGVGFYFLLFALQLTVPVLGHFEWRRMVEFWPGFLLVAGLAFLVQFVVGGFQSIRLFIAGGMVVLLAVLAFAFTLQFLSQTLARQLLVFWPVILILGSLWLVSQRLLKRS